MNARQQKIAYVYFDNFDGNTAHLNQILNMLYVFQKNGGPTTLITGRVNYKQLDAMLDALSITRKFNVVCLPIRLWQQWFFAELISRVVFSAAALVYLLFHTFHFVYSRDFFFKKKKNKYPTNASKKQFMCQGKLWRSVPASPKILERCLALIPPLFYCNPMESIKVYLNQHKDTKTILLYIVARFFTGR